MLASYDFLYVRCHHGYNGGVVDGADAVLGRVGEREQCSVFGRVKHSPGSGVLSARVAPDGPTRVLHITDVSRKVCFCICHFEGLVIFGPLVHIFFGTR